MELLVVILFMGFTLAVAIPSYIGSQKHSKQQACQANMAAIYQAEETYRVRNRDYTTTLSTFTADIGGVPVCPNGTASYTVAKSGSGSTLALTITCPNNGAHVASKNMVTSDGATFTFP